MCGGITITIQGTLNLEGSLRMPLQGFLRGVRKHTLHYTNTNSPIWVPVMEYN